VASLNYNALHDTAQGYLAYVGSLGNNAFHDTLPLEKQEEVLKLWQGRSR
jgi:hypothetical protein